MSDCLKVIDLKRYQISVVCRSDIVYGYAKSNVTRRSVTTRVSFPFSVCVEHSSLAIAKIKTL